MNEPPAPDTRKPYAGNGITIWWEASRCIHSGNCVRNLPGVFRPAERPWIRIEGVAAEHLADVVGRCPSGALTYERTDGGPGEPVPDPPMAIVVPAGPICLRGDLEIKRRDGQVIRRGYRAALCRCGHSRNKPFCDNSHREAGFDDR